MKNDLFKFGIDKGYTQWVIYVKPFHESTINSDELEKENDDMHELIEAVYEAPNTFEGEVDEESLDDGPEKLNNKAKKNFRLLRDAEHKLHLGSKRFMKLSFLMKLLHMKCLNGWGNNSFNMLLNLLKEALPEGETFLKNYKSQKIIRDLGFDYEKIDTCKYDQIL